MDPSKQPPSRRPDSDDEEKDEQQQQQQPSAASRSDRLAARLEGGDDKPKFNRFDDQPDQLHYRSMATAIAAPQLGLGVISGRPLMHGPPSLSGLGGMPAPMTLAAPRRRQRVLASRTWRQRRRLALASTRPTTRLSLLAIFRHPRFVWSSTRTSMSRANPSRGCAL
ncbi:hypothetical protein PINS_up019327 [Pythium insidiosum]|nr:hypothetical protein PINS_up019327 [Pythium insidiosum]